MGLFLLAIEQLARFDLQPYYLTICCALLKQKNYKRIRVLIDWCY